MSNLVQAEPSPAHASSYTTTGFAPLRILVDGMRQVRAVRRQAKNPDALIASSLRDCHAFEESLRRHCGVELKSLRTLEIGHGQSQLLMAYVAARGNDAEGVDPDVMPRGLFDVAGFARIFRQNGPMRCLKSSVRELTGVNRAIRKAFCKAMNLPRWPQYRMHVADATSLQFESNSFDLVYSTDVFEHLADPESCMKEVARVVKPGGAVWIRSNHYANYNAMHDLRHMTAAGTPPPPWAHLLSDQAHLVHQGAYVNKWRVSQFWAIADRHLPGYRCELPPSHLPELIQALDAVRHRPELSDYSSEELLAPYVLIAWNKPI